MQSREATKVGREASQQEHAAGGEKRENKSGEAKALCLRRKFY
jgi:hypothetical protein